MEDVRAVLGSDAATATWPEHLDSVGETGLDGVLPAACELPPTLLELAVQHEDVKDPIAPLPNRQRPAERSWLLQRCACSLV